MERTHFSFDDVGKLAAMIAVVRGFFSPLVMLPLFAPLKRSKHRVSMSFWKDGSSTPIGIVDSQHKSRYFSFVLLLKTC